MFLQTLACKTQRANDVKRRRLAAVDAKNRARARANVKWRGCARASLRRQTKSSFCVFVFLSLLFGRTPRRRRQRQRRRRRQRRASSVEVLFQSSHRDVSEKSCVSDARARVSGGGGSRRRGAREQADASARFTKATTRGGGRRRNPRAPHPRKRPPLPPSSPQVRARLALRASARARRTFSRRRRLLASRTAGRRSFAANIRRVSERARSNAQYSACCRMHRVCAVGHRALARNERSRGLCAAAGRARRGARPRSRVRTKRDQHARA